MYSYAISNILIIVARDAYYLTYDTIQFDVMTYGPIEASFNVYDDFFSYKSGKTSINYCCIQYCIFEIQFEKIFCLTQS